MSGEHDLEMIAANLRRDADDARLHGEVVLTALSGSLPPELTQVVRGGGLFRKPKVTGVSVKLGERRYVLKSTASGLVASVCHESGGVVISTTPVSFDAWVAELLAALSHAAEHSSAAAQALQRLAISGTA
ncbi:MAG: hypothetical protein QOJ62_2509 [Actinomycetota bacterium]|nr:hypothetical protein [Actinomycetota bacterium]